MMKYTEEEKKKEREKRKRKKKEVDARMKNVLLGSIHRRKSRYRFGIFIFENNLVGQG